MLSSKKKTTLIVGLDIGAGSIAAAEMHINGSAALSQAVVAPLGAEAFRDGEIGDSDELSASLRELFERHKLAKEVRVGLASQRRHGPGRFAGCVSPGRRH